MVVGEYHLEDTHRMKAGYAQDESRHYASSMGWLTYELPTHFKTGDQYDTTILGHLHVTIPSIRFTQAIDRS